MNWTQLITQLFEIVIFPLLSIGTIYLIGLIKTKIKELKQKENDELYSKYLTLLESTITECVLGTTQTYVDTLKKQGKFDKEAQQVAFQTTYDRIMKILSYEAKNYLEEVLGDLETYVKNKIEAEVLINK